MIDGICILFYIRLEIYYVTIQEEVPMAVRILMDSACDMSQERAAKLNVNVMPLKIRFGEDEYLDGVTMTNEEFYERLEKKEIIPKTSQIPPYEYEREFASAKEAGDQVLCFTLSSGVSGCYQSACLAAQGYEDCVSVIDTKQFCISELVIVERAIQLRDEGKSFREIDEIIREEMKDARVVAVFDTLEYLQLGGRLSKAAAFTGTLLSIKPVLTIEDGQVKILAKARGSRHAFKTMNEVTGSLTPDYDRPVCFGFTGRTDETIMKYLNESAGFYGGNERGKNIVSVGAAIGTYAGPGAVAAAFFAKTNRTF